MSHRVRGRLTLIAICASAFATAVVHALSTATITTDLPDYYPGDTVQISGSGWEPGETVRLVITQTAPPVDEVPTVFDVVADSAGSVSSADFRIQENHLGAAFLLTADGLVSGRHAEHRFTDSPLLTTVVLSGQTPNPVLAGNQAAYDFTINRSPGARNFDVALTVTGLPSGITFQFSPGQVNFGGGTNSRSVNLALTVASSVPTGTYPFTAKATVATNSSDFATASGVVNVLRDVVAPTTTATPSVAANAFGWNKVNVPISLAATDNAGGSGVKEVVYSATGADPIATTTVAGASANVTIDTEGVTTLTYFARDNAGNVEPSQTLVVRIDKTSPVISQGPTGGTSGNAGWFKSDVSVSYSSSDALSGLESDADASFELTASGEGLAIATGSRTVRDKAGNEAIAGPLSFKIDKTPPAVVEGATTGTSGNSGWYRSDVAVAFTATDATSGLASPGDGSFALSATGEGPNVATGSRIVFDQAGNSATAGPLSFSIDKTAPVLAEGSTSGTPGLNGWYWSPVSVGWTAHDEVSGLANAGDSAFVLETSGEGSQVSTGNRVVYDVAGNSATADARQFDVDLTDPFVSPTPDRDPNAFGWYVAPVLVTFNSSDAGSGIASSSDPAMYSGPDTDAALLQGLATDHSGRTGSGSITIKYDATAPQVFITGLDVSCLQQASIETDATDLFLASKTHLLNGAPKNAVPLLVTIEGPYTFVVVARDQAGNETTVSKEFTIDLTAPVILFGGGWPEDSRYYNVDKLLDFGVENPEDTFVLSTLARDFPAGYNLISLSSGYVESSEGRFGISLIAEDCAGNQVAANRTFYIDRTPPTVAITPMGTEGENGWYVGPDLTAQLTALDPALRAGVPSLDDIPGSGVASLTFSSTGATVNAEATEPISSLTLPIQEGITTVLLRSADGAGNGSGELTKTLKYDKTPPSIGSLANIVAEATSPDGAIVTLHDPSATDNLSDPVLTTSHESGSTFPLGETTVTVWATDEAGNRSERSYVVRVADTTAPSFASQPADIILEATGPNGAVAVFGLPAATDAVDLNPQVVADKLSGDTYPLGETTVLVTARDFTGNEASTSFRVIVRDTTPPALTLPEDIEIEGNALGGALVQFTLSANDIVDGDVAVTPSHASGSLFALGETIVTCEAIDSRGNKGTGQFKVKVVDTTAPAFADVPDDLTLEATGPGGAIANFIPPNATDIVDGPVSVTGSHASGIQFPLGETTVTFTAKDATGNTASVAFKVIVRDTTAPALVLPSNIVQIATSSSGNLVSFVATSSDVVSGAVLVVCSPASGSLFGLGTTTVNCVATDAAGNVATGSFTVSIVYAWSDVLAPVKTDGSSMFKLGSTIPIKFRLTGASAGITDAVARLYVAKIDDNPSGSETPADSTSAATTGNLFRNGDGQYIFNLGTKGLSTGRWRLRIDLGDGVLRTVSISLR